MKFPSGGKALIPIQLLLAILDIPSGALMLYTPGGESLGAQTILPHLRQSLPFIQDFTPVGIFLIIVYGLLPAVLVYGLWSRRRWAWVLTLLLGITEVVWIGTEVVMFYNFGFFFFYPIIAGMGIVTINHSLIPSVMRFYRGVALPS